MYIQDDINALALELQQNSSKIVTASATVMST